MLSSFFFGKRQLWSNGQDECEYQSYASLSVFDILGLSDQRLPMSLFSLLWCVFSILYLRCSPIVEVVSVGGLSLIDDHFYNCSRKQILLTPMRDQLLKMFCHSKKKKDNFDFNFNFILGEDS